MEKTNDKKLEDRRNRRRTLTGTANHIYGLQVGRSKRRLHEPPKYTRSEFVKHCLSLKKFKKLHSEWEASGFDLRLFPSFDRLDNSIGYSFNNIKLVTCKENKDNYFFQKKSGVDTRDMKAIFKVCLSSGMNIKEYYSAASASREEGLVRSNICKVARGERTSCGGFGWKYKTTI